MSGASSCYTTVDVFCFDDAVFIIFMDHRFFGCCKNGSHLDSFCAKHECCCHSSAICDTACCDHRNLHCVNDLRNQYHCGKLSDMTACLTAFGNDRICTAAFHTFCKCYGCNDRDNFDSGCFPVCHVFLRASGSCGNDFDAFLHDNLSNFF